MLWIDAATFLLSALAIRVGVPVPHERSIPERLGYIEELREGLGFLRRDRVLRPIILTVAVTNFLDGATAILMPVYVDELYGSAVSLGLLLGAMAGGSVTGALLYAALGERSPRHKVLAAGFTGVTLRYPVLTIFPSLQVALAGQVLAGAAAGPINPVIDTVSYERVPPAMRGRVLGVNHAVAWAVLPLGVLLGGFLLEWFALRATLILIGITYLATTLTLWVNPSLRNLDTEGSKRTSKVPESVS